MNKVCLVINSQFLLYRPHKTSVFPPPASPAPSVARSWNSSCDWPVVLLWLSARLVTLKVEQNPKGSFQCSNTDEANPSCCQFFEIGVFIVDNTKDMFKSWKGPFFLYIIGPLQNKSSKVLVSGAELLQLWPLLPPWLLYKRLSILPLFILALTTVMSSLRASTRSHADSRWCEMLLLGFKQPQLHQSAHCPLLSALGLILGFHCLSFFLFFKSWMVRLLILICPKEKYFAQTAKERQEMKKYATNNENWMKQKMHKEDPTHPNQTW